MLGIYLFFLTKNKNSKFIFFPSALSCLSGYGCEIYILACILDLYMFRAPILSVFKIVLRTFITRVMLFENYYVPLLTIYKISFSCSNMVNLEELIFTFIAELKISTRCFYIYYLFLR